MSDEGVQKVNAEADEAKQLRECPHRSDDEIADIVRGLVAGSIFTGAQCPPDMLSSVFMLLGLGGTSDIDPASIGMVYEHMHKANELAVNGYPTFFSCQFVHKDDWAIIVERAIAAQEALDRAAQGGK